MTTTKIGRSAVNPKRQFPVVGCDQRTVTVKFCAECWTSQSSLERTTFDRWSKCYRCGSSKTQVLTTRYPLQPFKPGVEHH